MNLETLSMVALILSVIPALLFLWNLWLVRAPSINHPNSTSSGQYSVSILIPARDEAARINNALKSVLANRQVDLEVIVLDDHSADDTANIVNHWAERDSRVRLISAPDLPPGWCGKQHACHVLARHARHPRLVFMDADVQLAPNALVRMLSFLENSGAALASGVPRQVTGTFFEQLLIPLVHFVLLGFLPVWRMRRCAKPAYAAGCGQLFICDAGAYQRTGGHEAIRSTLHDGIKLPRLFRSHGFRTDLFDATDVASCRMYVGMKEVFSGLMKNAHEGLASPAMILPMSLMLLGGQVLPWILLACWSVLPVEARGMALAGAGLTLLPRLLAAWRFRQSFLIALLQPLSVIVFIGIQWLAFFRRVAGKPTQWRGRDYAATVEAGSRRKEPNILRQEAA